MGADVDVLRDGLHEPVAWVVHCTEHQFSRRVDTEQHAENLRDLHDRRDHADELADVETFGVSAAAAFLVAIEADTNISELEKIMARTLWSVLVGESETEAIAYAHRIAARDDQRAVIAVLPPF